VRASGAGPPTGRRALKRLAVPLLVLAVACGGTDARCALREYDIAGLRGVVSLKDRMEYLPDPHRRHTWRSALADDGWRPLVRIRLGYLGHPVWTRMRVTNSADGPRSAILFNQRPLLQHLDAFVLDGEELVEERRLGFMEPSPGEGAIANRLSGMVLRLPAGAARTVLARLETRGVLEAGWEAATTRAFSLLSSRRLLVLGLYAGIMLSLIAHGLASWYAFRQVRFGLLAGYASCFLLFVLSINGFARVASPGLPPRFWFAGCFALILGSNILWIAFTRHFLDTAKTMPRMHRWLGVLWLLFAAATGSYVLGPWLPQVYPLTPLWTGCGLVLYASVLLAGILAVNRKVPHAKLYLVGHAPAFATSGLLVVIGQTDLVGRFSSVLLIHPWIVVVHVLVVETSLGMLARNAMTDLEEERRASLDRARFTAAGQAVGMIVHQWRTPLARLGTQLTELTAYFRDPDLLQAREARIRDELLPSMGDSMRMLTSTADDFGDFFSARRPRQVFDPAEVLDRVLEMLGGRIARSGVAVVRDDALSPDRTLHGHPSALAHVLMVLLGNALDALEASGTARPRIVLRLEGGETEVAMTVEDNGGGIGVEPLDGVFGPFASEKDGPRGGMGLGLGLARRLATERMGGDLRAENADRGARFVLTLPRRRRKEDPNLRQ